MPTVHPSIVGDEQAPPTPVPVAPPPPVQPRRPADRPAPAPRRRPGSPLGGLVISVAVLALGAIMLIDIAGASVATSIYFSVPLAVIGGGLVLGAWHGRARGLIAVGVILSVGLAITASVENWSPSGASRSVTWQPTGIEQLDHSYDIGLGNATLDLSAVDFSRSSRSVDVHVSVGNLDILVPPSVDVTVQANVEVGNAIVFGQQWSGINQSQRTITDDGADGAGGGELSIMATVDIGDLEVRR